MSSTRKVKMFAFNRLDRESRRWRSGPSDETIATRVIAGETSIFEVLMRRHNQRVYRAIRAILKEEAEIEDVMQQTYVDAFANLSQFRGAASFSAWILRIAVNEALSRLRQRTRFTLIGTGSSNPAHPVGPDLSSCEDPEEGTSRVELIRLLEVAVDELPSTYRLVFVLREVEGLTTRETAAALGVTRDVVKTRLRRSKLLIQRRVRARLRPRDAFVFLAPRCDRVVKGVLQRVAPKLQYSEQERTRHATAPT